MSNAGPERLRENKRLGLLLAVALSLGILVSLAWASPASASDRCWVSAQSVVVNEGSSGTLGAYAPGCQYVNFDGVGAGSNNNGWWSATFYATNRDGPSSEPLRVWGYAYNSCGGFFCQPEYEFAEDTTTITISNVAPEATFESSTSSVEAGKDFMLSLTNPSDPSRADVQAGFTYAFDCDGDGTFEQTGASSTATCTAGGPAQTAKGRIFDKDGGSTTYEQTVDVVEHTAPTGSVVINGGDAYTNNTTVSLTLSATDPSPGSGMSSMCFSHDGQNWSDWVAYATSKSWTLLSGDGTKTVYAQYKDKSGNESEIVQDAIDLESVAPTTTHTLSPLPNANGWNDSNVTVALDASDSGGSGVKEISYSINRGANSTYNPAKKIPISAEGASTISYFATDNAGNQESPARTLTVKIDKSAPTLDTDNTDGADGVTPDNRRTGVRRNIKPTATFSDLMDPASISTSAKLYRWNALKKVWQPVPVSVTVRGESATLDPYPSDPPRLLAANTKVKVTFTTGAQNVAGLSMSRSKSWTFSTGST